MLIGPAIPLQHHQPWLDKPELVHHKRIDFATTMGTDDVDIESTAIYTFPLLLV